MKGRIKNIVKEETRIGFAIELDIAITELDANKINVHLYDTPESPKSTIGFWVDRYKSTDEDDDSSNNVVPFQIAYAVSIHKAQGLEYDSVKIVITSEVEELITHNIFYTAITRAKDELKIYWSPETENEILGSLTPRDYQKDASLLRALKGLQ